MDDDALWTLRNADSIMRVKSYLRGIHPVLQSWVARRIIERCEQNVGLWDEIEIWGPPLHWWSRIFLWLAGRPSITWMIRIRRLGQLYSCVFNLVYASRAKRRRELGWQRGEKVPTEGKATS